MAGVSSEVPELPVVWRPRRGRLVTHSFAVIVLVVVVTLAVVVPYTWHLPDRLGIVAVGAAVSWVLYMLGRVRLVAEPEGLTVVNVFRTSELEWAEVLGAALNDGDPWVMLDLDDGETLPAMGIQASDGDRAVTAVAQLRALITVHGEAGAQA